MSKSKAQLAREHLERARPAVISNAYTEAVTWLFVSLEAAVVAIADRHGVVVEPNHWQKIEVAQDLRERGYVGDDLARAMRTLNDARKDAVYEGEEPDLDGETLEDLATVVEAAVEIAQEGQA